jgi:anti-sigma B factor antagonist
VAGRDCSTTLDRTCLNDYAAEPHTPASAESRLLQEQLLTIRSEREGPAHLIQVFGELDLATALRLDAELERLEAGDAEQVLLDLSGLDFIDAAGVRVLVAATARFDDNPKRFHMFRGGPAIERILRILGLDDRMPFLD